MAEKCEEEGMTIKQTAYILILTNSQGTSEPNIKVVQFFQAILHFHLMTALCVQ